MYDSITVPIISSIHTFIGIPIAINISPINSSKTINNSINTINIMAIHGG